MRARAKLFGQWEMNWLAYNYAHDVMLPFSSGYKVPFLMFPQGETATGRIDSLDPDNFRYGISARVYHPVHQISYPASPAAARFPEVAPVAPPLAFHQLH